MTVPAVACIDALSAGARAVAAIDVAGSYYDSLPWYRNFAATCLDPGDQLALFELTSGNGRPVVLFMRARFGRFGPLSARTLAGLSNYYSCRFSLTGIEEAADGAPCVTDWARGLRRAGAARPDRIAFDALDAPSASFDALVDGLREAGYLLETYPQFGNWFLRCRDLDFDGYWAGREASLRNTLERKERKMRRTHRVEIEVLGAPDEAESAVEAYEEVYAQSWKAPEPYRAFTPGLIRTGFATGAVSVGLLRLDGRPAAAQLWITHRRHATIFKLAHTEAVKPYSAGSILTRHLLHRAFREDAADEIDFGRGDDPYKRLWLPDRRQRWGLIAYDPTTPAGLAFAARNLGPKGLRRVAGRLLGRGR